MAPLNCINLQYRLALNTPSCKYEIIHHLYRQNITIRSLNPKHDEQMKLGQRLAQINSMIPMGYSHIWDCCCDHGFLGAALLDRHAANTIHFVDIVPALMQQLTAKLELFYPLQTANQWQVHCLDVSAIPLEQDEQTPLVIIAGIGGDLMIELVNTLCQLHPNRQIDFILCPVHHQYELRHQLIELDCRLIDEKLIEENRRFYEIIYVRRDSPSSRIAGDSESDSSTTKISAVGDKFWQCNNDHERNIAIRYLHKMLTHYQKITLSNPQKASQALQDYLAIKAQVERKERTSTSECTALF